MIRPCELDTQRLRLSLLIRAIHARENDKKARCLEYEVYVLGEPRDYGTDHHEQQGAVECFAACMREPVAFEIGAAEALYGRDVP